MRYSAYKHFRVCDHPWLEQIPSHWEFVRLKYMANCQPSNVDKKTKDNEREVFLCNYTDVYYNDEITSDIDFMKASATDEQIRKFSLHKDDVVITKDSEDPNDIAVAAVVGGELKDVVCGYHLAIIRPNANNLGRFIKKVFDSKYARSVFSVSCNGMTRYGLGTYAIKNALFPKPPKEEQTQIATFLDRETQKIDRLIEKQQQLIKLLQEKRQAVISHAVTKGLNPTNSSGTNLNSGSAAVPKGEGMDSPSNVKMKDSGVEWLGEIPEHWGTRRIRMLFEIRKRISGELGHDVLSITQQGIRVKDIESGEGQLSMDYSKYQIVKVGDFAMNHMDLLTGWVDISKFNGVTSPDYRVFSLVDNKSDPEYYLYVLQMGYYEKIFYAFGQGSSHLGRWRFPTENFKDFIFPYPPKKEQEEISMFIKSEHRKISRLIDKSREAIGLLEERRTALISAAVTGKIDVRNIVNNHAPNQSTTELDQVAG